MNLDDLQYVSSTAKCPPSNMTDKQWQQYFSLLKQMISQGSEKRMKSSFAKSTVNGVAEQSKYSGETSYIYYCQFINSVLHTIRGTSSEPPRHDYCYFIYQIAELLRFEHDRLKVIWKPDYRCFEVWLDP